MVKRNLSADFYAVRPKRSRTGYARKGTSKAYISKVARTAVIRMAEKKRLLTQQDEVSLSTVTQVNNWTNISDVAPNTGPSARIGAEILLHSVRCRGILHNNASGTNLVRMVVGYIKDQTAPTNISDLFLSSTGSAANVAAGDAAVAGLNAMYQPLHSNKITLLYDRVVKVGATGSVDGAQVVPYDFRINLRNKKIKFEGNTTGAGNTEHQLYIGAWATEGADDTGLGTAVEWSGVQDLLYTDL